MAHFSIKFADRVKYGGNRKWTMEDSLSGQATAKRFAQTSVALAKTEGQMTERENQQDCLYHPEVFRTKFRCNIALLPQDTVWLSL